MAKEDGYNAKMATKKMTDCVNIGFLKYFRSGILNLDLANDMWFIIQIQWGKQQI